jgi:hypothetical protein
LTQTETTFLVAAEAAVETVAHASVVIVMTVVVVMIAAHVTVTVTVIVAHVNSVNHVSHVKTDLLKSLSKMNSRANFVQNLAILVPIHAMSVVATVIVAVARDLEGLPLLP